MDAFLERVKEQREREQRAQEMEALTKRTLPTTVTVRNWRTVEALARMTA